MKKYSCLVIAVLFLFSCNKLKDYFPPGSNCEGKALQFDGVDDYVSVNTAPTPNYTIEAWVKVEAVRNSSIIVATKFDNPVTYYSHQIFIEDGKFAHYLWDGEGNWVKGTTTIIPDKWYHVAITATENDSIRLYVNGKEEGTPESIAIPSSTVTQFFFGSKSGFYISPENQPPIDYFKGSLDEVRIWDTALSQATIQHWMNKPLNSSHNEYDNLNGYWKMDEGSGTTTVDASSNKNDGTLKNGTTWITETRNCDN